MNVFRMAWRNVWRNSRRSIVTMAAMGFALWTMVLYSALVEGYLTGMEGNVLDFEVGDVQVFHAEYQDEPSIYTTLGNADVIVSNLETAGYKAAPRLQAGGLAAAGEASAGVSFIGVDVNRDKRVLRVHERIDEGTWLDPSDNRGVVIGYRLRRILGVDLGSEILVLSQAADGSTANELFIVKGVLGGVSTNVDRSGVFLTEAAFRSMFALPAGAHQIIVRAPAGVPLDDAVASIEDVAPKADVRSWKELLPTVATMLESTRGAIYIVFVIIYLAIGILVLNAMLMAVFERIREFGVMKAIGVGPGMVFSILVAETLIQASIAMSAGLILAIGPGWYLANRGLQVAGMSNLELAGMTMPPVWYGIFTPASVAGPIVVLGMIVAIAILYPALKAALIQPLDAMRYH